MPAYDHTRDDRLDLAAIVLRAALAAVRDDHGALADALDETEDCAGCLRQIAERLALNLAASMRRSEGAEAAEVRVERTLITVLDALAERDRS